MQKKRNFKKKNGNVVCTLALKIAFILLYKDTQYTDNKHLTYFRISNNDPSLSDINTESSNYM